MSVFEMNHQQTQNALFDSETNQLNSINYNKENQQ